MTNPAIEAVRLAIQGEVIRYVDCEFQEAELVKRVANVAISAMLDNLPRAEMEEKICMSVMSCDMGCEQSAEKRLCRRSVDAVISAARATLLPGDAT